MNSRRLVRLLGLLLALLLVPVGIGAIAAPASAAPITGTVGTPTGSGKVGTTLHAPDPVWNTTGVSAVRSWTRDGARIAGASAADYTVTAADVGKAIRVVYTGRKFGWTAGTAVSAPVTGIAGDAPTGTAGAPTGTPKVGSTLAAATPTWNQTGVTTTRQWLRAGLPITNATGATYVVTTDDVGKAISVRYTGTKAGHADGTITSPAVTGLIGDAPTGTAAAPIGSGKVGTVLTLAAPAWNQTGVTTTVQWLRAGQPIAGATGATYVVTVDDVGKAIAVRYTGTKTGAATGTITSASVTGLLGDAPVGAAGAPTGSAQVGTTLTAATPVWSVTGVVSTYQWLRAGQPIAGATAVTYVLTADDLGKEVSVRYTGTKAGYANGTTTSPPRTVLLGEEPTNSSLPTISGTPKAGATLTASPGTWSPTGLTFTYQWEVLGAQIPDATSATYVVPPQLAGYPVTVVVAATKPGYDIGEAESAPVRIEKLTSSTDASLVRSTIKRGKRGVVDVQVDVPGIAAPTGYISVYEGPRLVAQVRIWADDNGHRRVRLPVLSVGTHRLVVFYSNEVSVQTSASDPLMLKVRR